MSPVPPCWMVLLGCALVAGCKGLRGDGDGVDDPLYYCLDLLPSQCLEHSECAVIDAWRVTDEGFGPCVDFTGQGIGKSCHAAQEECLQAETLAGPDDGTGVASECWWFSDSCIPEGWVGCAEESYPDC